MLLPIYYDDSTQTHPFQLHEEANLQQISTTVCSNEFPTICARFQWISSFPHDFENMQNQESAPTLTTDLNPPHHHHQPRKNASQPAAKKDILISMDHSLLYTQTRNMPKNTLYDKRPSSRDEPKKENPHLSNKILAIDREPRISTVHSHSHSHSCPQNNRKIAPVGDRNIWFFSDNSGE